MSPVKRFLRIFRSGPPRPEVPSDAPAPLDPSSGGKGHGLWRLQEAGLPVPRTLQIPLTTYRTFLRRIGIDPEAPPVDAPERIRRAELPDAWPRSWVSSARTLGARVVVRSSGIGEDGAERSYAGVHQTVLGVPPEAVPEAVKTVWASAFDARAVAYGRGQGMVVLLQPLLEPLVSGVAFTVNPRTGSWRELVVEAVRGQGDALVSGRQAPQWAVLRRSRHRGARALGLRVLDRGRVPQPFTWTLDSAGALVAVPTPAGLVDRALLGDDALRALGRLCLRAERVFGEPVDVEWCWDGRRFTLLQARPITRAGASRPRDVLWTRRFLGERMPHPPTPMTWSILAPLLDHFIGYPGVSAQYLGGGESLRLHGGHAYLNVTIFRHLLFKWPGAPAPRFMLELLPPEEADAFRRSYRVRPDSAVYAAILSTTLTERRWERFAWNPLTNPAVWDAFVPRLRRELDALAGPTLGPLDAVRRVEVHVELLREYLSIHVCSLLFANLAWQLLEVVVAAWCEGSPADWMRRLAVSDEGNQTLLLNRTLHAIALSDADRRALARDEVPEPLRDFLARYGARAEASWEVFSPRWRDQPSRLLPLLAGSTPDAPRQHALALALAGQSPARRALLTVLVRYTRRYLLLRENQRFEMDRLMAGLQASLIEVGRHVALAPEDVPYLSLDELFGLVDGSLGEVPPIDVRRRSRSGAQRSPPVFLRGDDAADRPLQGRRLDGQGISAGRVRGRVRVVFDLAEGGALEAGEILVAPAVDPGWTPLLGRAGGLVLEMGSLLSHGAVVAREYGVPGVVNLAGVTRVLETGMDVTVDGSRGVVWVHARGARRG